MSAAWTAYRLMAPCLGVIAPAARWLASPLERSLWNERMGEVEVSGGCHAWVHAASLGEAQAVGPLLRELELLQPEARICLTATTRTGRARLGTFGRPVSLAPIDSPQATRRFFAGVQPERLFVVETELWPHWLLRADAERVPVAIVSARLSEGSLDGYRRLGAGMRRLVGGLAAVLCQTDADALRWARLGARVERTAVVGNPGNRAAARTAVGLDRERPLLVLGSVRPGEVRMLGRAWRTLPSALRDRWQVVAVPRHPRASRELLA